MTITKHTDIRQYTKADPSARQHWLVRDNKETKALSKADHTLVTLAVWRHNERINRGAYTPQTTRQDVMQPYRSATWKAITPALRRMYRTVATGRTYIDINLGHPAASGFSTNNWDVYAKRIQRPGKDAHISVTVAPNWLRKIATEPGLADAGEMLTLQANLIKDDDTRVWEASWLTQGRGFDLKVNHGFIAYRDSEWAHAGSIPAAKRLLAKRAKENAINDLKVALLSMSEVEIMQKYGDMQVTKADSRNSGNCASGTDHFAEHHFPGRDSVTVTELYNVAPHRVDVRRACAAAIIRHQA